jgi:hypothetical protein
MKTLLSFSSVPPRFKYITSVIENHRKINGTDDIWLVIPSSYKRFDMSHLPDIPEVKYVECDRGPATKFIYSVIKSDADIVAWVDDDTWYHPDTLNILKSAIMTDPSCVWSGSGFRIDEYFSGRVSRRDNFEVDVVEGYGMIAAKRELLIPVIQEYPEFSLYDDLILSNLLAKHGIKRKTISSLLNNHIKQYTFGFEDDSLSKGTGHVHNYQREIDRLKNENTYYLNGSY